MILICFLNRGRRYSLKVMGHMNIFWNLSKDSEFSKETVGRISFFCRVRIEETWESVG